MSAFHILQLAQATQMDLFDAVGAETACGGIPDPSTRPGAPTDDPRTTEGRMHRSMHILFNQETRKWPPDDS